MSTVIAVERGDRRNGLVQDRSSAITETTILLGLTRLEGAFVPKDRLTVIVDNSGLSRELSGLVNTLYTNDPAYARRTLMWSIEDVEKRGVRANPDVIDLAEGALGTERI